MPTCMSRSAFHIDNPYDIDELESVGLRTAGGDVIANLPGLNRGDIVAAQW